jgi:hypothetical protein
MKILRHIGSVAFVLGPYGICNLAWQGSGRHSQVDPWRRIDRPAPRKPRPEGRGGFTEYTEMMGRARAAASSRMIAQAAEMRADAIINVRYMTTSVVGSAG